MPTTSLLKNSLGVTNYKLGYNVNEMNSKEVFIEAIKSLNEENINPILKSLNIENGQNNKPINVSNKTLKG